MTVKISLSATEFPIKSVKVFSCGEAEVTRTFPLDLANCPVRPNESLIIEISKLPILIGAIGPPSLTTGSEDLLIMDYYCSDCRPNSFSISPPDVSSDVLRDLNAKCTSLEEERQLRQKSFAFLSTYMDSLAQGKAPGVTEPAQLVTFFDEFVELGKSRSEIIAALDQQISDLQKEIKEEVVRLRHECFTLATTTTVVLAPVHDHTINTAELELAYRVKATWKPVYEVHVTTIDGAPSSSVVLNYRCQISQFTGEDWDDVELVVTTANPDALLVGLPEPKKMKLVQMLPQSYHRTPTSWNIPGEGSVFTSIFSQQPPMASTGLFGNTQGTTPSLGLFGAAARPNMGSIFAQNTSIQGSGPTNQGLFGTSLFGSGSAQSQAPSAAIVDHPPPYLPPLNSNFSTFGESTTTSSSNQPAPSVQQPPTATSSTAPAPPSPLRNGQGIVLAEFENDVTHTATTKVFIASRKEAHHVLIATIPLKASFTRVAAPAVDPRVFYTCKITNTSKNVLISGPVHTYLDGNHVSDSKLVSNAQTQTIQCCLGVDPAVTAELDKHIVNSDNIAPLFPSYGRKTHTITITVKNTHKEPIGDLLVRASLPVSQNPRITVLLREPIGLATIGSGSVVVRDRCSARWSTTGDRTAENGGVIEWVCRDVQPGLVALKAAWDVTAPRDFNVVET